MIDGAGDIVPDDEALRSGELILLGRIRSASNATFLCEAQRGDHSVHCVYKPVAGEVKDLARATAQATTEITEKIGAVSDETLEAIAAIEQISGTIASINEIQHQIASAVEEQTAAINEIARSMNDVAAGSAAINEVMEGVTEAAQNTSSGAAQTQQAAAQLSEMAASLEGLVGAFRY